MKLLTATSAVLSMLATSVIAADLPEVLPTVPVEVFDWTGLYVGVQAGLVVGSVRVDDGFCIIVGECGDPPDPLNRYFVDNDLDGWKGGVHLGYDQQFGTFVLGAETDVNFNSASGDGPFVFFDASEDEVFTGRTGETSTFDMDWEGSARLKAGVALDRWLPYVTGGIAFGQASIDDHRIFGPDEEPRDLDFSHSLNLIGFTVGAGLAYAVTDNIIVRGEARFTDFDDQRSHGDLPDDGETIFIEGPSYGSFEAGLSFKF